jgi:hypothetical protein
MTGEAAALAAKLAAALPDLPRWVEIRDMLRTPRAELVYGAAAPATALVVADPDARLAGVAGSPPAAAIREGAARAGDAGSLLAAPEDSAWVRAALPEWVEEPAVLHVLPNPDRLPDPGAGTVRLLVESDLAAHRFPLELAFELRTALDSGIEIAAALADDGRPAAFCYGGATTERWWDVAIDALEPFRRRGHATRAFAFAAARFRARGLQSVWGAHASNAASLGLARKLGFVPADELRVFTPPQGAADSGALPT